MKILLLSNTLGLGGTERVVQDFAIYFKKQLAWDVFVGTYDVTGARSTSIASYGIPIYDLKNISADEMIVKTGAEIVFIHMIGVDDLHITKEVIIVNENIFSGAYNENADINFAISNALASKILLAHPDAHLNTLYYPFNTAYRSSLHPHSKEESKKKLKLPTNSKVIIRVARNELTKWSYQFIPQSRYLLRQNPDLYLVTVGMPLLYRLLLLPYASRIINFKPTGDDTFLATLYTLGDVYFHTAEVGETFGMVLAEAMFFGLPVISHSTHFMKGEVLDQTIDNSQVELIENKVNGIISNDAHEIDSYIKHIFHQTEISHRIAKVNKEKVETHYSIDIIAKGFVEAITMYQNKTLHTNKQTIMNAYMGYLNKVYKKDWYKNPDPRWFRISKFIYLVVRKLCRYLKIEIDNCGFTSKTI